MRAHWLAECRRQLAEGGRFDRPRWFCFGFSPHPPPLPPPLPPLPSPPPPPPSSPPPPRAAGWWPAPLGAAGLPSEGLDRAEFAELNMHYGQALTLSLLAIAITSIQVSLNIFGAERTVFWRESRHFSILAYAVGKNLAHLPLTLFYPFVFVLFFHALLAPYAPLQTFYLVFMLVEWAGEGMGQLISLQLNTSRQLAGGVAALVTTMLTGAFPLLNDLPKPFQYASYASFARWGMEALIAAEYAPWHAGDPSLGGEDGGRCCGLQDAHHLVNVTFPSSGCPPGRIPGSRESAAITVATRYGYTRLGSTEPDFSVAAGADPSSSTQACLFLVVIGLVLRVLAYASLVFKDRTQRR
jgi:hypothetical protein